MSKKQKSMEKNLDNGIPLLNQKICENGNESSSRSIESSNNQILAEDLIRTEDEIESLKSQLALIRKMKNQL